MRLFSLFQKSKTAYIPDCITHFKYSHHNELYKNIFQKLGINYTILPIHICSGYEMWDCGYSIETRKHARKIAEELKKNEITQIITPSPEAYNMFLNKYPEFLPDWDIRVVNLWKIIRDKLLSKQKFIYPPSSQTITFHDNCYLGRYNNIYEEPREILKLCGYTIIETVNNRENSFCVGSCGQLPRFNPDLANDIAKEKINQVKRVLSRKLVVASIENYHLLKRNNLDVEMEIVELSEILSQALGITSEKNGQENISENNNELELETTNNLNEEIFNSLDKK